MAFPATKENELPALGRPLHLGMLYDRRSDTLIPGITLWAPETLQKHVRAKPQPKTECHVLASDNYDNLASALNLTLPLKASLLGGKVDLSGSATYLKDSRRSQNQVRLVLHYSLTTRFEELTMSHLGPQNIAYPGAFDQGEATHVVTAVLYGAQAFLVFEREVASCEDKRETERELRASIQSMLQKAKKGGGEAAATTSSPRKEKSTLEKFRCSFYGDVALQNNPITDPDAMRMYSELPKLLGDNGEKAVPVKVWLYPLVKLDHRAAELVREVSTDLITRAQAAIEHLNDCQVQCRDLVGGIRESAGFPAMCEKITRFQDLCKRYKDMFREQLAGILPSIRGGRQGEEVLREVLVRKEQSPFSPKWLARFLDKKSAETDYVKMCCLVLKEVGRVLSAAELQKVLLDPQCQFLLSFTFTSLQDEEPYLLDLEEWILHLADPAPAASSTYEGPATRHWFEEETVVSKVRARMEAFLDVARRLHQPKGKGRFVVASVPDQENPGASMYFYEGGKLVSRDFWPPLQSLVPPPVMMANVSHDSVQLVFSPAAPDGSRLAPAHSGVEHSVFEQGTWVALDAENSWREESSSLLVPQLLPNTTYQFRLAAALSLGESSSETRVVKTLPTGPPGKPQKKVVESSAICVSWKAPKIVGEGVAIKGYKVRYREGATEGREEEGEWREVAAGKSSECCWVTGLRPGTPYRFQVSAVSSDDGREGAPSEEAVICTLRRSPAVSCKHPLEQAAEAAPSLGIRTLPVAQETPLPAAHGHPPHLGMPHSRRSNTLTPGQVPKREAGGCITNTTTTTTTLGPDGVMEMPALGRPFRVGLLYQCYSDALLSEHLFLDPETWQKDTEGETHTSRTLEKVVANTLAEKAAVLGVKASLLTSLLCGLFEVDGAAKFLLGSKKPRRHQGNSSSSSSATYRYSATDRVEQLLLSSLQPRGASPPRLADPLGSCPATHVVTTVWYGAQAFLEYDRDVSSPDHLEEVAGGLEGQTRLLATCRRHAPLGSDKAPQEQSPGHFPRRASGNVSLENNPVIFQDAVETQSGLPPRLLSESREAAVPVKVRLYPLQKLGLVAGARPCHEISDLLNAAIQDSFEGLMEIQARCNGLLSSPAARAFPAIRQKSQQFKELCAQHQQALRKQLAETVPLVRQGIQEEKKLEAVLQAARQSPFSTPRLWAFLDKREQEAAFVNSLLSVLRDVDIVCLQALDLRVDAVLAFVFTSLHEEEPYFSTLKAALASSKLQLDDSEGETQSSKGWFEEEHTRGRATEAAKSFAAFARANLSHQATQFVVASKPDASHPGASICLFQNGRLQGATVELPAKPRPVQVEKIAQDHVQLRLTPAGESGREAISSYQVEYRVMGQESWVALATSGREERVTVRGLQPATEYQFRYAARNHLGRSESSDLSASVKTLPAASLPEAPNEAAPGDAVLAAEGTQNSQTDGRSSTQETREAGRRQEEAGGVAPFEESTKKEAGNVGASHTACTPNLLTGEGAEPGPQDLLESFLRASRKIRAGLPSVYALPLEESVFNPKSPCLKYRIGKADPRPPHKVILLLGETGAGKSALVDAMVNYILGVQWEDAFRFSVAHQGGPKGGSQVPRHTEQLTAYEVSRSWGLQIPYSLTIIDTPGFGDTQGRGCDRVVLEQIREFFSAQGVTDHIDAICFVVQASQLHLTQPQKYVFNAMLSIFGSGIQDNIYALITFADGRPAPVLEAMKAGDVPCARGPDGAPVHFPFNNAPPFASSAQVDVRSSPLHRRFWQAGVRSLEEFFQALSRSQPQYLMLEASVLRERKELEAAVQGAKPPIRRALARREELRKIRRGLEKHQPDLEAKQDFEYELERIVPVKIDLSGTGYSTTNCQQCRCSCHYPCQLQSDRDKWMCMAMDGAGRCTVCPGKCPWEAHVSQGHRWDYWIKTEQQSYAQLKEAYQLAHGGGLMTEEAAFEWVLQESRKAESAFEELIRKFAHHLQRLQRVALTQPRPMSTLEFVDLLICSEKEELQPGYQERIDTLQALKKKLLPA